MECYIKRFLSNDVNLPSTIRESALRESKFLDSIGKAYMEQEIKSKVIGIAKNQKINIAKETGFSSSLIDVEIDRYLYGKVKKAKAQSSDNRFYNKKLTSNKEFSYSKNCNFQTYMQCFIKVIMELLYNLFNCNIRDGITLVIS